MIGKIIRSRYFITVLVRELTFDIVLVSVARVDQRRCCAAEAVVGHDALLEAHRTERDGGRAASNLAMAASVPRRARHSGLGQSEHIVPQVR